MHITSLAFQNNQPVPVKYTCKGPNVNPPLEFREIPAGAKSLVLMFEDVDAPGQPILSAPSANSSKYSVNF